jgi:hypothetical protein
LSNDACRIQTPCTVSSLVAEALASGSFDKAERLAGVWVERAGATDGPDSIPLARAIDWFIRAAVKNASAAQARTVGLAERAVRLRERHHGRHSLETERALVNRRRSLGNDHPHVASTPANLARLLADSGDSKQAISHLDRAAPSTKSLVHLTNPTTSHVRSSFAESSKPDVATCHRLAPAWRRDSRRGFGSSEKAIR